MKSYAELVGWFVGFALITIDVLLAVELLHRRGSSSVTAGGRIPLASGGLPTTSPPHVLTRPRPLPG